MSVLLPAELKIMQKANFCLSCEFCEKLNHLLAVDAAAAPVGNIPPTIQNI